jgi:hypothetical protein
MAVQKGESSSSEPLSKAKKTFGLHSVVVSVSESPRATVATHGYPGYHKLAVWKIIQNHQNELKVQII